MAEAMYPPDETIWPQVEPHTWKYAPRWHTPRLILIHATRGNNTMELQYQATKNWQISPNNRVVEADGSAWASMSDRIISHEGQLCRTLPEDRHPTWSAGHMDPWAISYELAQPPESWGLPFTEACLDRAAREVAQDCVRYGIPAVVLPYVSGDNHEAPGIARHDRSANGTTWGKSDPGRFFDDRGFERRVRAYIMPQPTPEQVLAIVRALTPALLAGDVGTVHAQIHYLYALAGKPQPT